MLLESSRLLKRRCCYRGIEQLRLRTHFERGRAKLGVVVKTYNPNTAEEARSGAQGFPWVYIMFKARMGYNEILSEQNKTHAISSPVEL